MSYPGARHSTFKLFSIILLGSMLLSSINATGTASARAPEAKDGGRASTGPGPEVIWATGPSVSQPLRSFVRSAPAHAPAQGEINPLDREPLPKVRRGAPESSSDRSIVQRAAGPNLMPSTVANFDGVNNINGVYPPDTNGDIGFDPGSGKKYYMQWVNLSYRIWDVTNPAAPVSVVGPFNGNTLFSGFGGVCQTTNYGDPIVLFDHLANRWLASQFASDATHFWQCIAISTSADPTGSWYRYGFLISTTKFNDYPKFGVWPDGYYMSINQFHPVTDAWLGAGAVVFDRAAMLSGAPATGIYFDIGAVNINYGGMLPSDLDGPAPAAGTPNYFAEWDDSVWMGDPQDTLRIWNFHVDWVTPENSTFGNSVPTAFTPNQLIATSDVDSSMCVYFRNCIPQPGTEVGLDAISDRLLHRLQYRNFGAYQTLVSNHTVDVNSTDWAGVHWFELQRSGGAWSMHQQGVYAPDADNRWMGSIAMDQSGDMALGYSVSSSSTYPSIRYTGRLASDTLGTLPQGEASLMVGSGSQTGTGSRWGDYSMMGLDPTDDCTFWYTNEYLTTTGQAPWRTRIGSFKFPECVNSGTSTISGNASLADATVSYTGGSTSADGSGVYSITVANGWDGIVTPSKPGYSFEPPSRSYFNVQADYVDQDYTATPTPLDVEAVYPAEGSQTCARPQVGVDLAFAEQAASMESGGPFSEGLTFDGSTIMLKLDDIPVLGTADIRMLRSYLGLYSVLYMPTADLTLGMHEAALDYPSVIGPQTRTWNFTVGSKACETFSTEPEHTIDSIP